MGPIWVLVADNQRARFFRAVSATGALQEVEDAVNPESRLGEGKLRSDGPGRVVSSSDRVSQHAYGSDYSEQDHVRAAFARSIVERLDRLRIGGELHGVYLMAEPGFMGLLRSQLPKHLHSLVLAEVARRVTEDDPAAIRRRLPRRLGWPLGSRGV